jgi:hypothetical protein
MDGVDPAEQRQYWVTKDAVRALNNVVDAVVPWAADYDPARRIAEMVAQFKLLMDFGTNRERRLPVKPSWLSRNSGFIPKLAQSIYNDQTFNLLPNLADALEDAGCDNANILNHCRGPGPHVRGCWVVDLLLGKS